MPGTLTVRLIGAMAVLVATGGCSVGHRLSPEAFRRGMPLAIVTVSSLPDVTYSETRVVVTNGVTDMGGSGFKAGDARTVFPSTKAAVLRALSRSRRFKLVPEETVLSSAAYASAPAGPFNMWTKGLVAPKGYKLVLDEAQAGRIARSLGASGALFVALYHNYTTQGVPGGRIAARVGVQLTAVDRSGQTIWTDYTHEFSERTLDSSSLRVPLATLEPLLAESAERGTRALLARLDEQLGATR
jgi:hypothetical protein